MRERVLADDEIPDIWNACPRRRLWMDCPLLILTAIRRDAVGGAAKDEVCLPDRKWSIDGARMPRKASRAQSGLRTIFAGSGVTIAPPV
jgi:hypothetical protein